jgi:hypothetical protein
MRILVVQVIVLFISVFVYAGPYTEPGVNGYVGEDGRHADPADSNAVINPIFRGWATSVVSYVPAPGILAVWADPNKALGEATGDNLDVVSLGDLDQGQIGVDWEPGQITLAFDGPARDCNGYDFVIFENGLISLINTGGGSIKGQMFAELGYVEVSSNGVDFIRFPSVSLTAGLVGMYGTIEISDVYNLAGKHPNGNSVCTGTPFDLSEIAGEESVLSGVVDINNISYIRIVDIPGSGDFEDEAAKHIEASSWPAWDYYANNHSIYDAWLTFESGGVDLEAVGILQEQNCSADINLDGIVDMSDYVLFSSAWGSHFGQVNWIGRCDLAEPRDYVIDRFDLAVFCVQWLKVENWRSK